MIECVSDRGGVNVAEFISLADALQGIHQRLSADLAEQLDGWRGWTVRRAWIDDAIRD